MLLLVVFIGTMKNEKRDFNNTYQKCNKNECKAKPRFS